jgi:hypothetical protein
MDTTYPNLLVACSIATGKEAWRMSFGSEWGECGSQPQVRDGTVYLFGGIAGDKGAQGRPGARRAWHGARDGPGLAQDPVVLRVPDPGAELVVRRRRARGRSPVDDHALDSAEA